MQKGLQKRSRKFVDGHWFAAQIALHLIAVEDAEQPRLLLRFDTFGDNLELQCMRQVNDGGTSASPSAPTVMSITNERSIFSVSTGSRDR